MYVELTILTQIQDENQSNSINEYGSLGDWYELNDLFNILKIILKY